MCRELHKYRCVMLAKEARSINTAMKVTFITNYLTHHQQPFAEEMFRLLGDNFRFIATNPMDEERIRMGWSLEQAEYPYLLYFDDDMKHCSDLVMDSDVVICGGTHEVYISDRIEAGKITLRYFERLYKKGQWRAFAPRGYIKKRKEHTARKNKPVYLLCAGAYVPSDFHLFGAYPGKMLKWGYFPEFVPHNMDELMGRKKDICNILWAGRMIGWKHAMDAVEAVKMLLKRNALPDGTQEFHLTMVGDGECASDIREMINGDIGDNMEGMPPGRKLSDVITLRPFMKPKEVRRLMEESSIYLMTSDYEEGWGAVVNEAMNSGCSVIASDGAGCVPYLIRHGENGMVYHSGNVKELSEYLAVLIQDSAMRKRIGENAYRTIETMWQPAAAAERMVRLCEHLLQGEYKPEKEGPLAEAELIAPRNGYAYCHGKGKSLN